MPCFRSSSRMASRNLCDSFSAPAMSCTRTGTPVLLLARTIRARSAYFAFWDSISPDATRGIGADQYSLIPYMINRDLRMIKCRHVACRPAAREPHNLVTGGIGGGRVPWGGVGAAGK